MNRHSNQKGSYQFEKLESRTMESRMLAKRAQMRLDGFPDLLKRHGYPGKGKILEVGTAQGIRARIMAEQFPDSKVVAIDRSPELLIPAIEENKDLTNLKFKQADIYDLPFPDESFDFIYARLVFMHLDNPLLALTKLKQILKPGGRLLIEDADRDCMFFEPAPQSFPEFWRQIQEGQRRLGGDPNVGRKLGPLLTQSGFKNTLIEVQPILGKGADIDFLVQTLMPSLNVYLDPKDRDFGKSAIADLALLAKNPLAQFYHFWFVVSGEK